MKVVHTADLRIATLTGHIVRLEANVPRNVPDAIGILALGQGAKQLTEDGEIAAAPVIPLELSVITPNETRAEKLVRVMKEIIVTGDPSNFRQDGQPKTAVLNRLFGENIVVSPQ
jgi:hypothetical protein